MHYSVFCTATCVLAACIGGEATPQPEGLDQCAVRVHGDVYAVVLLPYQGKWPVGTTLEGAAITAAHEINESGGVTSDGSRLGLILCDTKGDQRAAFDAAQEVIEFGPEVVALLGPVDEESFDAVARELARPADIAMITFVADSPAIGRIPDADGNVFRFGPSVEALAVGAVESAALSAEDRVTVFHSLDPEAETFAEAVRTELASRGQTVFNESFDPANENFVEPALAQLELFRPTVVFIVGFPEDAARLLRGAIERGIDPRRWVLPHWLRREAFLREVGHPEYVEAHVVGVGPSDTGSAENTDFATDYETQWAERPDVFADVLYDAVYAVAMAIRTAPSPTRGGVRDRLASFAAPPPAGAVDIRPGEWATFLENAAEPIRFVGAAGVFELDADGNRVMNVESWSVVGGHFRGVYCWTETGEVCE